MKRVLRVEEDTPDVGALFAAILDDIAAGRVVALALVTSAADGGMGVEWGAARRIGTHAGTVLRGMVAYLGATMDAAALAEEQPIAFGGGEDTWTP